MFEWDTRRVSGAVEPLKAIPVLPETGVRVLGALQTSHNLMPCAA